MRRPRLVGGGGGGEGEREEGSGGSWFEVGDFISFRGRCSSPRSKNQPEVNKSHTFPVLSVNIHWELHTHTSTHARTHAHTHAHTPTHTIQLLGTNSLFIFVHCATSFISFTSSLKTLNSFHKHFLQFHCQTETDRNRQTERDTETGRQRERERERELVRYVG